MKTTKKIFAVLIAFVLTLSMAIPAFAAGTNTITVKNTVAGETYTLYKMADLTTDGTVYTYTASAAWADFFKSDEIKSYFNVDSNGVLSAVDSLTDDSDAMKTFGKLAIAYAKANSITPVVSSKADDTSTNVAFTNLDEGYYLISSTLGTLAVVESTPSNKDRVIEEKNEGPGLVKQVEESGTYVKENDAQIGQTVNFKVTISAKPGAKNYVMHDKMEPGLSFNTGSVAIANLNAGDYTVKSTDIEDGCAFELVFTQAYLDTITEITDIVVTYSAVLTADALDDADGFIKNDAQLSYGDNQRTEWDTTKTNTHTIDLLKYRGEDADKNPLADATFQLKNADKAVIELVKIDDNNYRLATADDTNKVTSFTTNNLGKIHIKGLDSGKYYLTETEAPAGYNILNADTEVIVKAEENIVTIEIANNSGTELPSTGGMGTTILYIIGGVLVVGAAVVLIVKKRTKGDEEA